MVFFDTPDIGIDLGTSTTLCYVSGRGIVIIEPSVVALDKDDNHVVAFGRDAKEMIGRTPGKIIAQKPLRKGVISDYTLTERMLKYFIDKAMGKKSFRKPRVVICIPSGATEVERKAVEDATYQAGAREVEILEEPYAAAIGAGLSVEEPRGNMIIDIGGGTTDVAVISYNGIVCCESLKLGGDDFDEAVVKYMKETKELSIGLTTAEVIKKELGCAIKREDVAPLDVKGRSISGYPQTKTITSDDMLDAFAEPVNKILETVHNVFDKTPPELAADIFDSGIYMTGGGSLLYGLPQFLHDKTGIDVVLAKDPVGCVINGVAYYIKKVYGRRDIFR